MTRRIIQIALTALLSLLGILQVAPAQAGATASSVEPGFVYDGLHTAAIPTYTTTERGPPAAYDSNVDHDADGQLLVGASARQNAPTIPATYDYDDLARLVQTARGGHGAEEQVDSAEAGPVVVERLRVAANGGQKWAYRGVARDHPGYDDALKGRVNPRNPNGTATPEQHNLGNTTDSPYTSWTRDPDIARRFAGPDGVVLRVPRGEGSPYKFEWSPDVYYEQEILIRGPVCGALIC